MLPDIDTKGRLLKTAYLADEWFLDVPYPSLFIHRAMKTTKADLFAFWPPLLEPHAIVHYQYPAITEQIAVMPVTTYEAWHSSQIDKGVRYELRKAEKAGVQIREAQFDEAYIAGMVTLFNESPMRQGMRFWHYGKSHEQIRQEFSRFLHRETLYGAYLGDELVGILWLCRTERYTVIGQILSSLKHRNKSINNALIAHAVKMTAERGHSSLIYAIWPRTGLEKFKHSNGFRPVDVPHYMVPLTLKGRIAVALGLHEQPWNWKFMPAWLFHKLHGWRSAYYTWRTREEKEA